MKKGRYEYVSHSDIKSQAVLYAVVLASIFSAWTYFSYQTAFNQSDFVTATFIWRVSLFAGVASFFAFTMWIIDRLRLVEPNIEKVFFTTVTSAFFGFIIYVMLCEMVGFVASNPDVANHVGESARVLYNWLRIVTIPAVLIITAAIWKGYWKIPII